MVSRAVRLIRFLGNPPDRAVTVEVSVLAQNPELIGFVR